MARDALGQPVDVRVEVAAGGRVKRHASGRLHYISPVPSPFAYGAVPGVPAPDGDLQDALVVGADPGPGDLVTGHVIGRVLVTDDGVRDDKWVVATDGPRSATAAERARIHGFFEQYERYKTAVARLTGRRPAVVHGMDWLLPR